MTQDQLNHVKQVLAEFRSSKVAKIDSDRRLEVADQRMITFETVKGWYTIYLEYGSTTLAEQIGILPGNIIHHFKRYNLPLRDKTIRKSGYYLTKDKITQKHRDTLLLSITEWNNKYGVRSQNSYYKTKKTFSKYLQDQNILHTLAE